jgi:hypothetical protein
MHWEALRPHPELAAWLLLLLPAPAPFAKQAQHGTQQATY